MASVQECARAYMERAHAAHAAHLTKVDVVEFGDGDEPVTVFGKKPTIAQRSKILKDAAHDPFEQALRTVVELACDENGDRLFTIEALQFLRTKVDADVIEALAARLNTGLSYEAAKKNSMKNATSDTGSGSPNDSG